MITNSFLLCTNVKGEGEAENPGDRVGKIKI